MDCAFDDDRTIVVAMVDLTIPTNLVLYIVKKRLASTSIFSNSFDHRASKLNTSFYMVTSLCIVFLIIFLLELLLNLLLIFLLILIILGFGYKLILSLMLIMFGIYWLPRARRLTSDQMAQLVEYLPSDPNIVGSNLDSALNTFSFKNAKI